MPNVPAPVNLICILYLYTYALCMCEHMPYVPVKICFMYLWKYTFMYL